MMILHPLRFLPITISLGAFLILGCSSEPPRITDEDSQQQTSAPEEEEEEEEEADRADQASQKPAEPAKPQMSSEAFRLAAHDGKLSVVRDAIESGMDIESKDTAGGYTALHMAAYNGHTDTVEYLISQGAAVDPRDSEGKTPLIHACTGPFVETVKALIEGGADVNAKDRTEAYTPLMMAAGLGQPEIVQVLLQKGADKTVRDQDNEAAVDHARNAGHEEIIKLLEAE